jgi:hypothetical protein
VVNGADGGYWETRDPQEGVHCDEMEIGGKGEVDIKGEEAQSAGWGLYPLSLL